MSELFEKSIRTLELPAVLEKLAAKAVSQAAKDRCLKLTPSTDVEEVLRLLDETDAAKERLGLHGSPSFSGVKDVSAALTRADHGGMLNTRELLDIAGVLTASRRVSDYDAQRQGEETVLDRLFASLHTNKYLEEQIRSAILDEETIADTASSELADIRRKMRLAASKGRQILQRIISSPSYAKVLQEALITQRDGRFVVPVKAECKGSMPGLVHDISSSGATLFVEPMGVVQANNELKELEAREQKEIDRILRQLSAACAAQMENILWDYDILVHLDVIFARAQLSYQLNASRIRDAGAQAEFHGAIYDEAEKHRILTRCRFGLNLMRDSVCIGLTMKSVDYWKHDLPVINNIPADSARLVEAERIGLNLAPDTAKRIAAMPAEECLAMRKNVRRVFDRCFDLPAVLHEYDAALREIV